MKRFLSLMTLSLFCIAMSANIAEDEPNNDLQHAQSVEVNSPINATLGNVVNEVMDVEDWYCIELPSDGSLDICTTAETSLRLGWLEFGTLIDGEFTRRNQKDMDAYGKDPTIVFNIPDLAKGTYYLRVKHYLGYGGYILNCAFTQNPYANDEEPNDEVGKAQPIACGQDIQGRLGYSTNSSDKDVYDWYCIELPSDGSLDICTTAETSLRLGVLDFGTLNDAGEFVRRNYKDMDAYGKDPTIVFNIPDLAKGTYYLRVKHYLGYGGYILNCAFTQNPYANDEEANDEVGKAQSIACGQDIQGRLGYSTKPSVDMDVCDWYCIELPADGSLDICTTAETSLRLGGLDFGTLNDDGEFVRRNYKDMDAVGVDTTIVLTIPDLAKGTYYLRVDRYLGYGGYILNCAFTPHPYANDEEANDEVGKAQSIACNKDIQGRLGYYSTNPSVDMDVYDWYCIEVPSEGSLDLRTTAETSLRLGRLEFGTLNDAGEFVRRNYKDMDAYGVDTTIVFNIPDLAKGTYYLRVTHYLGYGGYILNCAFTQNPYANDEEPNDEVGNAQSIVCNKDVQGRLGYSTNSSVDMDVYDWYCIEVPSDGSLDLRTTAETSLRLGRLEFGTLVDGEFTRRNHKDMDACGVDTTIVFNIPDLAKGTYYLRVRHYHGYGGYILNCAFTPNPYANDEEPNDEVGKAQPIACGQDIQGHLGYYSTNPSVDMDVYDWYCIEVPSDGSLDLRTTAETSLRLGGLEFGTLNDAGEFVRRNYKDMDAYGVDTTIVFNIPDLAKGAYYLRVRHYHGYGGYILNCAFTPNPYYTNDIIYTKDSPCQLVRNKANYTTMGYTYSYNEGRMNLWYEFSTSEPTTLEIQPDTTKSLVIGVVEISKKNADGSLTRIYSERLERTYRSFEISAPGDYLVYVPRYNGYGGISVRYGDDESGMTVPGSVIRVSVEGRNTVRKGVPCQNTVVVRNTSDKKTGSFLLAMACTDDIKINKINLSDIHGRYGEDMMYEDICNSDSSIVLYIPSLAPFEEYRVLVTSEGVGDIDYVKAEFHRKGFAITGTVLIAAAIGFAADACVDAAGDWIKGKVKEKVGDLSESEAESYRRCMGLTRQQYEDTKYSADGYGACVAKKAIEKTMQGVMKVVPGGSTAMKIGEKVAESADIITCMRRKLWYWIYKDIGLIKEDDNTQMYDAKVGINGVVASWDPNEMVGPQGVGDEHYIGDVKTVNYTIMFENKAEAGAPAYRVRVFDELDPNVFDVNSVRFGSTSHDGMGYSWKMLREGNKLTWDIEGIELPPNKVAPEGEGYVTFSVDLKPGLPDGTQISNKATIIFDKNTPIETNVFTNVLDLEAPTTTMLSAEKSEGNILVKCQSVDTKSGVGSYALYVSKDNGAYEMAGFYPDGEMLYTPVGEGEYSFYVLTVDQAGNAEAKIPNTVSITTDVKQIMEEGRPADGVIYDLSGRRVQTPRHGVYIQNGRKVLK